ncbi:MULTISPECIES: tRNA (uridine(54)-C5)-methyltransferase TrmA [Helicobacter]|nr:tRNA (uridine(54)-C5)-methyltransferase TrmA [Helicobacter sp. MIT 03-1616]TLD90098.1 tRNA (uridine(54)-C5)-methyltransferase TrmA [Helicobacter sp. MIT 03-1616]
MECRYFGICGGCDNFTQSYTEHLQGKYKRTLEEFEPFLESANTNGNIEVFLSPESGFRARSEMRFFYEGSNLSFAMMNASQAPHKVPINTCTILRPILQNLMPLLCEFINTKEMLKSKIYACNLLCGFSNATQIGQIINAHNINGTSEEVIITLIYHKHLDAVWEKNARELQSALTNALNTPIHIIGRSKNQALILGESAICESISLCNNTHNLLYLKQEGAFSQPNPFINIKMLEFVATSLQSLYPHTRYDALELYCGSGNFTLILAAYFHKVLATEVVKSAIKQLQVNMAQNHISNIYPSRLNAHETLQALRRERAFFRLKDIDLDSFCFDCVLIDPPRSGVNDVEILTFLRDFSTIIYISCNPTTLLSDMQILCKTHRIFRFGLFDQFPYTSHRECIVILRKN